MIYAVLQVLIGVFIGYCLGVAHMLYKRLDGTLREVESGLWNFLKRYL